MKKILTIMATLAVVLMVVSCGDDDSGINRKGITRTYTLLNHIVKSSDKSIVTPTTSVFDYTVNDDWSQVDIVIRVKLDGKTESTYKISGLSMTYSGGVYSFKGEGSGVTELTGHIDTNEGTVRINYYADGYRVIGTSTEVYSTSCTTYSEYADSTNYTWTGAMYQFNIDPETMTAQVVIMDFIDKSKTRTITNCKSTAKANVVATETGYKITAEELPTATYYIVNGKQIEKPVSTYPIADLDATLDLEDNKYNATMLFENIRVTATGSVNN